MKILWRNAPHQLLERYVHADRRYDNDALALLHNDHRASLVKSKFLDDRPGKAYREAIAPLLNFRFHTY